MPAAHLWAGAAWGSPLAPARDGTGWGCSHGSPPTRHRSRHVPQQGWRRAEDPLSQRRNGWLHAWSLSPPSPHLDLGTKMSLARKMLQKQQLGGSGSTSPGVGVRQRPGASTTPCYGCAILLRAPPSLQRAIYQTRTSGFIFLKKQSCVWIDFDELTFSRGKISSVEVLFLGVAVPYCTICNPPGTLHKAMNS